MTRLQVPQHYKSVAIWKVHNTTSPKVKSNKQTEAPPFAFLCFFPNDHPFSAEFNFIVMILMLRSAEKLYAASL